MTKINLNFSCFPETDRQQILSLLEKYQARNECRLLLIYYFEQSIKIRRQLGEVDSEALLTSMFMMGFMTRHSDPELALKYFHDAMGPNKEKWEPLAMHEYAKTMLRLNPDDPGKLGEAHEFFKRAAFAGLEVAKISLSHTSRILMERQQLLQKKIQSQLFQPNLEEVPDLSFLTNENGMIDASYLEEFIARSMEQFDVEVSSLIPGKTA